MQRGASFKSVVVACRMSIKTSALICVTHPLRMSLNDPDRCRCRNRIAFAIRVVFAVTSATYRHVFPKSRLPVATLGNSVVLATTRVRKVLARSKSTPNQFNSFGNRIAHSANIMEIRPQVAVLRRSEYFLQKNNKRK